MEEKQIFKAYLRGLSRQYEKIQEAITARDYVEAERLLDELMEDTRKGIEE